MSVPFRFDSILRIRLAERDSQRQELAIQQSHHAKLVERREHSIRLHAQSLDERRQLQRGRQWTASQGMAWEEYAKQISKDVAAIDVLLAESQQQLSSLRQKVVEADKNVKALEKLRERHTIQQARQETLRTERDVSDSIHAISSR